MKKRRVSPPSSPPLPPEATISENSAAKLLLGLKSPPPSPPPPPLSPAVTVGNSQQNDSTTELPRSDGGGRRSDHHAGDALFETSVPLGQRNECRNLPSVTLYNQLEGGLAQCQFVATEIILRARQAEWRNVQESRKNHKLSQMNKGLQEQVSRVEAEKEALANEYAARRFKELTDEVERLKSENENLKSTNAEKDDACCRATQSLAVLEVEKQKEIDLLKQQRADAQKRYNDLVPRLDAYQKEKSELQTRVGELSGAKLKADKEVDALSVVVRTLEAQNDRLKNEFKWVITDGLRFLFKKIKSTPEFSKQLVDINYVMSMMGYQNGLRIGYKSFAAGIPIERAVGYDPDVRTKLEAAVRTFDRSESSLLAQIAAMYDSSFADLKAMFLSTVPSNP